MSGPIRLNLPPQTPTPEAPLKLTRSSAGPGPSGSREDLALPRWLVIADLRALTPGQRGVAARLAGVPEGLAGRLEAAGLVLPVAEATSRAEAEALAAPLRVRLPPLEVVNSAALTPSWAWQSLLAGLGLTLALGLAGVVVPALLLLLPVVWLLSVGGALGGAWQGRERKRRVYEGYRLVVEQRTQGPPRAQAARARARKLLEALGHAELPEPARAELERALGSVLTELERLEAHAEVEEGQWTSLEQALDAVARQTQPAAPALEEHAEALRRTTRALDDLDAALEPDASSAEARARARLAAARKAREG